MDRIPWYIFVLAALFLVLVYYKGFNSDVGIVGSNIRNLVLNLTGRSNNGKLTPYA